MRALIVDDEPLARAHLRRLLESLSAEVVGEAGEAPSGLQLTEDLRPDLVLLDVQMPGLNGIHMAAAMSQLSDPPLIVFVTGFSEHAVAAFDQDALDYLVKPVSADRLARTLTRARERMADRNARRRRAEFTPQPEPLRRLPIRLDYAVRLLRLEEVLFAAAAEKRVMIHTSDGEHRTYYSLKQLESLLPADRFFRIHDSYIVNLDSVQELIFLGNHSYVARLANGRQLPVGKLRFAELQRRLGLQ